jgi:hypothetical protein
MTMWSPSRPALTDWSGGKVVPKTVLYYYDGPTIFTANVGLIEFLFYKIDEGVNSDLFLIAPTSSRVINALQQKTLSVRGALASAVDFWIVDVAGSQDVRRFWKIELADIDSDLMPDFGLALGPLKAPAANFVEQAESFFSALFIGDILTQSRIPFLRFKALVEASYASFRKIFPAPVVDDRSLERSLDFDLLQPKFSSLIIAIDKPKIDFAAARKYVNARIDENAFAQIFEENRLNFFNDMSELLQVAEKGEIKRSYAVEHFYTLDQVNDLVPTSYNDLDRLEFRSQLPSLSPLIVDDRLGDKLRSAHQIAEHAPRQITGVIVDINEASKTLVILNEHARQVTCTFERGIYQSLMVSIGDKIRVRGNFIRRKRRDRIHVDSTPQIISK